MFDLRSAITSAVEAADFGERTVTVFDYGSTERCLESIEKAVFTDAAVFIGDWVKTPSVFSFGWTRVENGVELIVAGKSAAAKAALNDIITTLSQTVNRTKYDQATCLTSQLDDVSEMLKTDNESLHYHYATVTVVALENASTVQNTIAVTRPVVDITSPANEHEYTLSVLGDIDISIVCACTVGDATLSKLYLMAGDYEADGGDGLHAFQAVVTNPTSEETITFSVSTADFCGLGSGESIDYKVTVILEDSIGACGTDSITITITDPGEGLK